MASRPKTKRTTDTCSAQPDHSKKPRILQKFLKDYSSVWPVLKASAKGANFCHCETCRLDFSIGHGGRDDCKRHVSSKKHTDYAKLRKSCPSVATLFKANESPLTLKITKAEALLVSTLADNNLPLSAADTFTKTLKVMFPDSEIARGLQCGRSKATAMLKELAEDNKTTLAQTMQDRPFTVSTDGSNDAGNKLFPIVVRTVDETSVVKSSVLSVPVCEGSATGRNIFRLIEDEFRKRNIPWENCLSLGCDNANVMTGGKEGLFGYMKREQPSLHLSGCVCHLIHIGAEKGAACLPLKADEILIDTYFYLDKSSNRQQNFKQAQLLHDVKQAKVIKHVSTRWLSLNKCLIRLLDNWEPLLSFVKSERNSKAYPVVDRSHHQNDAPKSTAASTAAKSTDPSTAAKSTAAKSTAPSTAAKSTAASTAVKTTAASTAAKSSARTPSSNDRLERMYTFLKSPTKKLYILFLTNTLPVFEEVNLELQSDEPMIHIVRRKMLKLLKLLFLRFLKPVALHGKPVLDVQFHPPYHHKADADLLIGDAARKYIANGDRVGLRDSKVTEFYSDVKAFFIASCTYLKNKLPFKDELLIHVEIADIALQLDTKPSSVRYFLNRFPCLLASGVSEEDILLEFSIFQATDITTCKKKRLDETWKTIAELKDDNGAVLLKHLPRFMLSLLTIPHSSAHCERVFSCVRKNRTDQRASMGNDTLDALLVVKSDASPVWKRTFSNDLLQRMKSSYTKSLSQT